MIFRKATINDRNAIRKLIAQFPDALIQNHIPDVRHFFVAEDSGNIIGCCALEVYSKRLAEIRSLAVSREFQGLGVATKLINQCLKLAHRNKIYEVLAITGRPRLFKRFGFDTFHKEKLALLKVL